MDFKQIEAFLNVVKYKGFSKAAEATYLTQPTISAHISSLEKELNVKLINRRQREIALTSEGKLFYSYAITLLNTREKAIDTLQNYALNINETLVIQSSVIPGCYLLPKIIAEFKRQFINSKFNIQLTDSRRVASNLIEEKGEIGFTGNMEINSLCYELIAEDKAVLIAPNDDSIQYKDGDSIKLKDIAEMPLVMRENGSATLDGFCKELDNAGITLSSLNIVMRVNSIDAIRQAVKAGVGVSVISEVAAEKDNIDRGYKIIDIEDYTTKRQFYMVYDNTIPLSPIADFFKTFIIERYCKQNNHLI